MELTEDETTGNFAKKCGLCGQNSRFPYEYVFTCFSCGYNVIKRKHELSKTSWKKINFINRLKYADQKMFCIWKDV